MSSAFLFAEFPLIALGSAAGGLAIRYALTAGRIDALQAERSRAAAVLAGGKAWRIGLAGVLLIHLAELVVPRAILEWNGIPWRLYALEGGGLLFGALTIYGSLGVVRRDFVRPGTSVVSAVADAVFLSLFVATLTFGWVMQALYRWGSSWGAAVLAPYVLSVLRGHPASELANQMPFLVRLHVVTSFAVVGVFPFTSFALLPVAFVRRGVRRLAAVATRGEAAVNAVKWRVADSLWPEEDTDPEFQLPETWVVHKSGIVPSSERQLSDRNTSEAKVGHDTVRTAR
jgi:nitrate reductase gamma subunit